ncbi:hypothetical protein RLO149_c003460 [Roseobacter litoralis Och 149]|uniref:Uncharacterized protein n=1 Tax=Roseobacter litoralis (strain ATCC 49566 / DSM 6996 / JCM 21268 / NBRC 15278 / OCh 149) TaxID=391595 RepID=F7ZHG5_ROSLO|nr:hypothetical protein RLO149_c003460 [Roseobacter litoralis Och 149]
MLKSEALTRKKETFSKKEKPTGLRAKYGFYRTFIIPPLYVDLDTHQPASFN